MKYQKNLRDRSIYKERHRLSLRAAGQAGFTVVLAVTFLSGCAQGLGDWPTLSSALGWGGDGVPAPEFEVVAPASAPARVAAARGTPDLTAWSAPPAPPMPAYATPLPVPVAPAPIPYSSSGGTDLVAQSFSDGIAATAPTILKAPSESSFASPSAQVLSADLSGIVPRVVLETYNQALSDSVPGRADSALPGVFAHNDPSGLEYLDPVVIKFERGSSRLSPRDKRRIGRMVKEYRSQGGTIYVIGHASSRTGDMKKAHHYMVNFAISVDRANVVTDELVNQGVPPENLVMEARADRDPIFYEYMPRGEAGNQRVEIFRE